MPFSLLCTLALTLVTFPATAAEGEIHRCPQDDGTVSFQETPCPEPASDAEPETDDASAEPTAGDDFFDFVNPYDQEAEAIEEAPTENAVPLPPPVSQDKAECEKITRDAIDAIDLEMRRGYSAEDGERYKAELMKLTRQLRACKQL